MPPVVKCSFIHRKKDMNFFNKSQSSLADTKNKIIIFKFIITLGTKKMMNFEYQKYTFNLELERKISTDLYIPYALRSILGMQLKRLTCIFSNSDKHCPIERKCSYCFIFESIIDKNNSICKGIQTAPHPFVITSIQSHHNINTIQFELLLVGEAIDHFPHIFQAFKQGGTFGLFKERVKYKIKSVFVGNKNILNDEGDLILVNENKFWSFEIKSSSSQIKELNIKLKSPFRFQKDNRITGNINYPNLLQSAFRRAYSLSAFYGENALLENPIYFDFQKYASGKEIKTKVSFKHYKRYSARQKREVKIGGLVGRIDIQGSFSNFELSLLKSSKIVNIGKNTALGFGKIDF